MWSFKAVISVQQLRSSRTPTRVENATATTSYPTLQSTPGQVEGGHDAIQPGLRNCKLEIQQPLGNEDEPPLYILSGQPAIVHPTPPKKAPRTSGWKDVTLSAANKAEDIIPPRPPRRHNKKTQTPKSLSTTNTLKLPEESIERSASSNSLSQNLGIPEETIQRLEEYLKKNQSFSSLQMLMSQLQAQTSSYAASLGSSSGDENWAPVCSAPGEDEEIAKVNHSKPPVVPTRKRRSIENKLDIKLPPSIPPPPPPPLITDESSQESEVSSEHDSIILSDNWDEHNEIQSIVNNHHNIDINKIENKNKLFSPSSPLRTPTSPSRLTPFINFGRLTSVDENNSRPGTPGPWFDRGLHNLPSSPQLKRSLPIKNVMVVNHPSNTLHTEIQQQVTPPPSENDDDTEDEMPEEITHSVLLKILQQCSDEFGSNKMVTRRASILANNLSFDGLHDFINNFQKVEENNEETESNTPSIGELRSALADLLENEKINEKEFEKEQKIISTLSPSSSSLSLQKSLDK